MTAKVTYLGEDDGPDEIEMFGQKLVRGKSVAVSDDFAIRTMGNPHFRIDKGGDDIAAKAKEADDATASAAADAKAKADAESAARMDKMKTT